MNRVELVAEARLWVGTPYVHQARLLGVGVDCAGIIALVPKDIAYYSNLELPADYAQQPDAEGMRRLLTEHLDPVGFKALLPGDVIWFRMERQPQHLGIVTEIEPIRIIHASNRPRVMKVVEEPFSEFWRKRVQGCFRYRGISECS